MTDSCAARVANENSLSSSIEARLAEQVGGLRAQIPVMALAAIYEDARGDFEKQVAASILHHFLGESKRLLGFHQFFLESYQLRLVAEQRILSLEDLVVELRNNHGQLGEVSNPNGGLPEFLGGNDCGIGGPNE